MSKLRTSAVAAAAFLIAIHVSVIIAQYGSDTASLVGDWIDTLAPLIACVECWLISRQAGPFGRRVWRLVAFSALLAGIGQGLYTDYYDYVHAPLGTLWPSDVLVFFWVVPILMTVFLSPRDRGAGYGWLRLCDFAQVCTLVLAVELSQIYVPSRWLVAGRAMQVRALHAGIFFFGLIAVSFIIRTVLTDNRSERTFFGRLAIFLTVHAIVLNVTLYWQASGTYRQGQWPDLMWTVSFCLLILLAGTWNVNETERVPEPQSRRLRLVADFSPLLIPAIVFALVLSISEEQFFWSVVLVIVSFAAASGRLFVVQRQLLASSRELERNLALLRGITEGTTDAVFVKDLKGRYLMINSAGAGFLGRKVQEIMGKTDEQMFDAEVGRVIMERDQKVLESGVTQTYEEFGTAAGVTRLYSATKGPFRDPGGQVIGLLGICRDITNQRRAEEEIRQSQQKLRIHLDHTPLAVVEWDLQFRVTEWNPSAERIFGYSRQEAIGQYGTFIVPQPARQQVDRTWRELIEQQGGSRNTNDNVTKNGRTISCEWYNTPLVDDSGRALGVASLVQDVTERVALEEKLRQSQKMEAVGRLAGGVAHDFNNLLTVILGYSQILTDSVPAGSLLASSTAQIKSAAEKA
ncbi:MAG TPA: PAS domain-containing protein, partial [Terracidiphilus sp.]